MLRFDETDKYELKETYSDTLPKEIETYLNTEGGGYIYIGVNKNGEVVGIKEGKLDEIMLRVADVITDQVLPKCTEYVHTHHEVIENKDVIVIDIKRGNKLYYQKKYGMTPKGCHYRVGTKCQEMAPEEIEKRFIASLNIPEPDICEMESYRQDLTFQILKNYLITHNYHFNDKTFETNLRLRTSSGKYNYMAFMLADKNDIVINVATFATTDKSKYLKRDEFGGVCLLYAMEKAKDYVESSYNQTFIKLGEGSRKEKKVFNNEAFEQAWYNACVHNKWSESNNPGIYIYSDRLEIESRGSIPARMSKEDFYRGVSNPVNKKLFDIFKTCGFGEESGHGVPTVVSIYGEKAYRFTESYINVIIPFDKSGFDNDDVDVEHPRNIQETSKKHPRNIQEEIYELMKSNQSLTMKDIMKILNISEGSARHNIKKLKDEGRIEHKGSTKSGYWEIK